MTAALALVDLLFGDALTLRSIGIRFVFSVLGGIFLGFVNWNSAENVYRQRHPNADGLKIEDHDITGRTM